MNKISQVCNRVNCKNCVLLFVFAKTVVEKVGSDDGATRLPEEYKELEKVVCVNFMPK